MSFRIIDSLLREKCNKENLHYLRKFPLTDNSHLSDTPFKSISCEMIQTVVEIPHRAEMEAKHSPELIKE